MTLTTTPTNALGLTLTGSIELAGAEIVSYDAVTRRAFVTSGAGISIVDLADPATPALIDLIDFTLPPFGFTNNVSSVAVANGIVAVSVINDPKGDAGRVFLLDTNGNLLNTITVGAVPDHVSFTPDGLKILVANEGEIDAEGSDPLGSVSIIDVSGGAAAANVTTADFSAFNSQIESLRAEGVRLFAGIEGTQFENTTVAQDLEPEYIAIAADGLTAMVTLQEANSVAILDLTTGVFTDIVPLGLKSFAGLAFDASDRDGPGNTTAINLRTDAPVFGQYMPDAIASFTDASGATFYVTANEGDDREDFIDPGETVRVGSSSYNLDDTTFTDEALLKMNGRLGRLTVTNYNGLRGDTDGDGDIDQILTYGARSFSILDASGNIVFDSGDQIERFVASLGLVATGGVGFDDTRSDNKGAEPEGVSVSVIGGRVYAFVTLERANGTMVYDVTDPTNVTFVEFAANNGDVAPEIAKFVAAAESGSGQGFLMVANEGSNTVSFYQAAASADDGVTRGSEGADTINTRDADDAVFGLGGNDRLGGGNGADRLSGGEGDDVLVGNDGEDLLYGDAGNDRLGGLDDDDRLDGGDGDDVLTGNAGDDVLIGGLGFDRMFGGAGADTFVFRSVAESPAGTEDRIVDFSSVDGDRIDLSGIDANTLVAGNNAFSVVTRFSGAGGELRLAALSGGRTFVLGDTDGDRVADFTVMVAGDTRVTAADLILGGSAGAVPTRAETPALRAAELAVPAAGSIAIIAFGADTSNKSFSFVLLDDSLFGQTISYTDNGWLSTGGFRSGEGFGSFMIPTDAMVGSVFTIAGLTGSLNPSTGGDAILVFTGTQSNPTFLWGNDFANTQGWDANATSSNTSAVPTGLVDGETALSFATDNGYYNGPMSGSVADILAGIADETNWVLTDNDVANPAPTPFTILTDGGAAAVSIDDVTVTEGDAGETIATFTVTRSDTDGAFTVDFATADGSATAGSDYVAQSGTLTFTAGGSAAQTISIVVNGDTTIEPSESFTVNLSNLVSTTGEATISDTGGTATILNDDVRNVFISDIQGDAFYSPILAEEGVFAYNIASSSQVTVTAVITALDTFGPVQGFYISEELSDWDANPLTSEGIFVRTTSSIAGLTVGETVTVTASVMEFQDFTNLPRTILTGPLTVVQNNDSVALPTFVIGSDGRALPTSVTSNDNPDFFDFADDANDTFDPAQDALDYYETLEGMRVTLPDAVVADGFVAGSDDFVRFGAYSNTLADQELINSRGGYTITGNPENYPEDNGDANDDVLFGGRVLTDGATHPDILELDFGNAGRGGTAGFDELLTMGDRLGDVTGILDFDFQRTKIFVTDALDADRVAALGDTPVQEVTTLQGDARSLRVATFNVENLSPVGTTFSSNNGVEITTEEKFDRLADHLAINAAAPDIIIVQEVQDNNGIGGAGVVEANETWDKLVAELNQRTGKTYQWVDEAPEVSGTVGGAPGGNIRVGFLYDTARVQLGDLAADATIAERRQFTDRIGDGVRTEGDRIAVDDAGLGINAADWAGTRRSIVGEFTFNGQDVFVFGSHLPSKGGSGQAFQLNQNNDAGAPANGGWADRVTLAEDLWQVQNKVSTTVTDARVVSGGDFNEFWFYRPLDVLTGYGNIDGTARVEGTKYTNLMVQELSAAERFSYDFDGRSQALDTILADGALAGVASYDVVHINTGYNERAGAVNPASSDHDPSVASFDFRDFDERLVSTAANDSIDGFGGRDTVVFSGNFDGYRFSNGGATITDVDATNGDDGIDTLANVEILEFADRFVRVRDLSVGTDAADDFRLGEFDDLVFAGDGGDAVNGGAGADEVYGEGGNDRIRGGQGDDRLNGGIGNDAIRGEDGDDTILGNGGDDVLTGGQGRDAINGGEGADKLFGDMDNDALLGGGGNDIINGGEGDDTLIGGTGVDRLFGGVGADRFVFQSIDDTSNSNGYDRIGDFSADEGDIIDLSAIDANGALPGDTAFSIVSRFTGTAGELRIVTNAAGTAVLVSGDVDGDRIADFGFAVSGDLPLQASDFAL